MKNRNPIAVALLPLVTFGIYSLYWYVVTKGEMNARGAKIPTAWLLIIPLVNIWWLWKYSEAVEQVTGAKLNGMLTFVLLWLLGFIAQAIVQDSFNNNVSPATASAPAAPEILSTETTPPASESTETTTPVSPPPTTPLQ